MLVLAPVKIGINVVTKISPKTQVSLAQGSPPATLLKKSFTRQLLFSGSCDRLTSTALRSCLVPPQKRPLSGQAQNTSSTNLHLHLLHCSVSLSAALLASQGSLQCMQLGTCMHLTRFSPLRFGQPKRTVAFGVGWTTLFGWAAFVWVVWVGGH